MLVSIVVPIYNSAKYIEKCVTSLLEQTYDEIEYIFIDDASSDDSRAFLDKTIERFPSRKPQTRIISHKVNQGSAMARSAGLHVAKGDYILQADSDDYCTPDYVEKLVSRAEETGADIVVCDYSMIIGDKLKPVKTGIYCQSVEDFNFNTMIGILHNGLWNKLIRRSLFVDNDIDFIEGLNMSDDKSVMFRLGYCAKSVAHVDSTCYFYNNSNPIAITNTNITKLIPFALSLCQLVDSYFENKELNDRMKQAISFFKKGVEGMILIYSNSRADDIRALGNTGDADIMEHPFLPYSYKLAVKSYENNCNAGVAIIRSIRRLTKR